MTCRRPAAIGDSHDVARERNDSSASKGDNAAAMRTTCALDAAAAIAGVSSRSNAFFSSSSGGSIAYTMLDGSGEAPESNPSSTFRCARDFNSSRSPRPPTPACAYADRGNAGVTYFASVAKVDAAGVYIARIVISALSFAATPPFNASVDCIGYPRGKRATGTSTKPSASSSSALSKTPIRATAPAS
eukprot:31499-Pelagococcus_subviridis.AAC.48